MKERPILFSGAMVKAILDGRKTMTRRVLKNQPPTADWVGGYEQPPHCDFWKPLLQEPAAIDNLGKWSEGQDCPYGKPGDCLWIRETFAFVNDDGNEWIDYKATPRFPGESEIRAAAWDNAPDDLEAIRWRPSIHMPRVASRITLEITNVRVERLQNISEADAEAEGFLDEDNSLCEQYGLDSSWTSCRDLFRLTWDKINGKKHPWSSNPWVWVIEFKKI